MPDNAPKMPESLEASHEEIRKLRDAVSELRSELDWFRRQMFGKRSERIAPSSPDQSDLLAEETESESELQAAPEQDQPHAERRAHARRGRRDVAGMDELPIGETIRHDVAPEEKICSECGCEKHPIPPKVSWQLEIIPARLYRVRHERLQYACPCCQGQVSTACAEHELIEKGLAGPGLLAHVIVSKYADHLPLHRQETIFARHGARLSRATLCAWIAQAARELGVLVDLMAQRITKASHAGIDETKMLTLQTGQCETSWVWTVVGGADAPYVVYHYHASRGRAAPDEFLKGFTGTLQSDDYGVYEGLCRRWRIIWAGCWAHARRKFEHAWQTTRAVAAREAMERIGKFYEIEREIAHACADDRLRARGERSRPMVEELFTWLTSIQLAVLPKSPLGKAIAYALSNRAQLSVYLSDPEVAIDNNRVERSIRPVVVGRKNYQFVGSAGGGKSAATLYSLIESAKRHGHNVYDYLRDVITRLAAHPRSRLAELLPDQWSSQAA